MTGGRGDHGHEVRARLSQPVGSRLGPGQQEPKRDKGLFKLSEL